ncbi:uncharacterized protein LOC126579171 [Anopheles aquasalis]|uniref:uncharacterized protein LOC126579171 n=1 Tax=Anopheles aquasalis TaxID=42839 RepID=UPI00215B3EB5|nr:uncharacterized protein LOC126579171 [Anopheles aquasalis]
MFATCRPAVPLLSGTVILCVVALVSSLDDTYNIELKQKDSELYHEQSFGKNEFSYGYQVEKVNSQFQHKMKGPDDVTYGCYGWLDPMGEKHLVYYIADRLGYRLLAPDQPTKVFTDRVANSVSKLDADLQGRKLDEKVVAWNDLYLPSTCRRLDEIVSITPPPTQAPQKTTSTTGGVINRPSITVRPTVNGNGIDSFGGTQNNGNPDSPHNTNANAVSNSGANSNPNLEWGPAAVEIGKLDHSAGGSIINVDINGESNGDGTSDGNDRGSGDTKTTDDPRVAQATTPQPKIVENTPPALLIDPVDPQDGFPSATTYRPPFEQTTTTSVPDPRPSSNCGTANGPFSSHQPKFPNTVGQFNGFVFPINRNCDASGRTTEDLLAQMQAINQMVLRVSETLHRLIDGDDQQRNGTHPNVSDTCQQVLQLLNIQQPVPLLVYVPIMLPYLEGGIHGVAAAAAATAEQKPAINPASYAYAKSCSACK